MTWVGNDLGVTLSQPIAFMKSTSRDLIIWIDRVQGEYVIDSNRLFYSKPGSLPYMGEEARVISIFRSNSHALETKKIVCCTHVIFSLEFFLTIRHRLNSKLSENWSQV